MTKLHISGYHRDYSYHVRYTMGDERADVDVYHPDDGQHYSFELAVISRSPGTLPEALKETACCWIDGIYNRLPT
jgi:hypothetical protein